MFVIGHVTTLPITYWMHPDRQNHPCLVFLHFFFTIDEISFFGYIQWTLKAGPAILHTIPIFCSRFLASQASIWNMQWNIQSYIWKITMKDPGLHFKIPQWNAVGICWKSAMKYPGIHVKNCNEMHWVSNGKSQWNTQGYIWKIAMKYAGYVMKNRNEMHWVSNEKSQWNALGI